MAALKGESLKGLDTLSDAVDGVATWALESTFPTSLLNVEGGLTVVGRGVGQAVAA